MIQSHCDEAIPLFEEAQKFYRDADANHWVAGARINIGLCYSQLGDIDNAFTYRQAALGLSRPSLIKANALGETGTVLLADDPAKAVPWYREARDMARQFGAMTDAARWAGNLSSALAAKGEWDQAEAALQDAKQLGPEPRSRVFLDLNAAAIALGRGRPAEARAIFEGAIASSSGNSAILWQAHAGIASTWIAEKNSDEAVQSFEAAIRVVEGAQSDLNRNEHKITFLARLIRLYQDYVDLLMSRDEPARALAVADRSRARLLSERIARRIGREGGESEPDFRSIARKSENIWLAYWIAPKRSFLWVVTPAEVRVITLPAEEAIRSLVKEYRGFVETAVRDPMQTRSEAGSKLYDVLIAPAAALLPKGSRVTVVPDGPLHQLSFDTLPVYGDSQPRYLMDDAIVSISPSFGVFRGGRLAALSGRDALIIGAPVSASPEFPTLKHATQEIENVAGRFSAGKAVVVTGEAARPDIWKTSNPGRFSTIHIAAHAEANERSPLDSAIILSPSGGYRLYARDIIDVPLQAELVSLSACRSSGARTYAGEGMVGFAWSFLHAGARSVIAGLWDVADESTPMLMDRLYAGIAAGEIPAAALRKARLSLRQTAYAKPFYWGAFQLYTR
jgi:CHAT domain-containing protein